jgi:hypothetical protein
VALHREIEGGPPLRPQPVEPRRIRQRADSVLTVATGTVACPSCDAPVLPDPGGMAPPDPMTCGFCGQGAAVRDFLSLGEPTRPTRVTVRIR